MDKRKNNGGARANAGRKPKDEEQSIVESLKPYDGLALTKLTEAIEQGKDWAVKLFFNYRFGMPKQQTDITTGGEKIGFSIKDVVNFK